MMGDLLPNCACRPSSKLSIDFIADNDTSLFTSILSIINLT
jgi:hypothetical protein